MFNGFNNRKILLYILVHWSISPVGSVIIWFCKWKTLLLFITNTTPSRGNEFKTQLTISSLSRSNRSRLTLRLQLRLLCRTYNYYYKHCYCNSIIGRSADSSRHIMSVLLSLPTVHEQVGLNGFRIRCRRRDEQTPGYIPSAWRYRANHQKAGEKH